MKFNALIYFNDSYDSYYLSGRVTEVLKYIVIPDMNKG